MNKSKIDWPFHPLYTWNPVVGCPRNCFDGKCWAKNINKRFNFVYDFNKINYMDFEKSIKNMPKRPSFIFVGSMSDICFWDHGFIRKVINFVKANDKHIFIFLTKNPKIYTWFEWPRNTILGLTVTGRETWLERKKLYSKLMCDVEYGYRELMLSVEPLLGIVDDIPESINYVIVGALKGSKPKQEWIDSIKINPSYQTIYWKKNIRKL